MANPLPRAAFTRSQWDVPEAGGTSGTPDFESPRSAQTTTFPACSLECLPVKVSAMHLLHAASELHPYSKTGGLADMVSALARALARSGHTVEVVTPLYRGLRERFPVLRPAGWRFNIRLGDLGCPGGSAGGSGAGPDPMVRGSARILRSCRTLQ